MKSPGTPRRSAGSRAGLKGPKSPVSQPAHARLPLAALRMFAAVAARCSFSEAAQALHVSTAAVSMQIKALEDYLQVRLLRRSARGVDLTAEGERLVPYVQRGLDELEQGFRMVRAERSGGVLVVSMLSSFLNSWLTMRLPDLFATHPEIDLRMQCTPALADFSRSDVHVAIRIGRGNWPRLHVEKLFDDYLVPLCSPKTLARHGSLPGPGTTANYPLLYSSSEPWEMWTEGRAFDTESWPERGSAFDDSVAILTAAVHGEGLVLSRWSLAQPFLASGQLVRASSSVIAYGQSWYFVCPTAYLELRKVQGFRQWLLDQAAAMPQP